MTTYVADHETGNPLCPDCGVGACISTSYECRDERCRCSCGSVHSHDDSRSTGGGLRNGRSGQPYPAESTGFPHPVSSGIHRTEAPINR